MSQNHTKTRTLIECAVMLALGTILAHIKLFEMPNGGSVTVVSMLPFIVVSYRHGVRWGLLTGFVNSLLQITTGTLWAPPAGTAAAFAGMILLDYVLAFMVLGLAGLFGRDGKPRQVALGTVTVCALRFLCSFLSGFLIWASLADAGIGAVIYSLQYNASYMVPETVITTGAALLLCKRFPALFGKKSG